MRCISIFLILRMSLKKKRKERNKELRDKGGVILTASIQGIQDKQPGEEKATAVKI